ncbi:hypothetical protein VUR80DRAFT_292 [Thermomyces stellatus]
MEIRSGATSSTTETLPQTSSPGRLLRCRCGHNIVMLPTAAQPCATSSTITSGRGLPSPSPNCVEDTDVGRMRASPSGKARLPSWKAPTVETQVAAEVSGQRIQPLVRGGRVSISLTGHSGTTTRLQSQGPAWGVGRGRPELLSCRMKMEVGC